MDLEQLDMNALNNSIKNYRDDGLWQHRMELADGNASRWQSLISNILTYLAGTLAATDVKGSVIATPTYEVAQDIVNSFNETEFGEWKVGVRRGVETNDWRGLITHRTYISDLDSWIAFNCNHSKAPKAKGAECSPGCSDRIQCV
jgi:hypothetical protein